MKKKTSKTILLMAISGLVIAGVSVKKTRSHLNDDLMLANVEALAEEPEETKEKKTCGTKDEHIVAKLVCPETSCKAKVGFTGVEYSYKEEGDKGTYLYGRIGTDVKCSPYHGMVKQINDVKILSCK